MNHANLRRSLIILAIAVLAFSVLVILIPRSHESGMLAFALFFGMLALFKLVGQFEKPCQ